MGASTPTRDHSWSETDGKRALKAVELERHIREVVDTFPPLTSSQRDELAAILRTGRVSDEQPQDAA